MHARTGSRVLAVTIVGLLAVGVTVDVRAQEAVAAGGPRDFRPASPTWAQDVAPILYESCVRCHNPEGIGPMSLLDYQSARRYAQRIRSQVEGRNMPPWHIDRTAGVQRYKNDASLSDEEIRTIVAWVDGGAAAGDLSAAPPPPELPDPNRWELEAILGPPDFVVRSGEYVVQPNAQDQWFEPSVSFAGAIDAPRYVKATELRGATPDSRRVLHHGHANYHMNGERGEEFARPLGRQGVGKGGDLFPPNTGMLIMPEGEISWGLHYFPIDRPVVAEAEAAVWLYAPGEVPAHETRGEVQFRIDRFGDRRDILIPPNSVRVLQGVHMLESAVMLNSVRPHLHMRGREQSIEAVYPDGRREMLFKVNNYSHVWQIAYQFEDDARPLLPKGTVLLMTSVWDNTSANPLNPDPDQWVAWGQRGVDEMSHVWIGMTYLSPEEYEREMARRGTLAAAAGPLGNGW